MRIFGKKSSITLGGQMLYKIRQPIVSNNQTIHIPIWYVFKDGNRIDLNNPSLIIEDLSGKYQRYRQLGYLKIKQWQMLNKILPKSKTLTIPNIVFYQ